MFEGPPRQRDCLRRQRSWRGVRGAVWPGMGLDTGWLRAALAKAGASRAHQIVLAVLTPAGEFANGAPRSDDLTLFALKRLKNDADCGLVAAA